MRVAITFAAAAPPALGSTCWLSCECAALCPAWGAVACIGIALAAGLTLFVTASTAWELHLFSRHRPPRFHTEGSQ